MKSDEARKPVFMRRKEGMPFAEFKKVCLERLRNAGYFEEDRQSQPPPTEHED